MIPEQSVGNLLLTTILTLLGLFCVAVPIGVLVALLVRRTMPLVNMITVGVFAGYTVGFVVLFAVLRRLFVEMAWYNAASISLVVTAGIVFVISYFIKRSLYAEALSVEQQFSVFGEDARDKPRNLRRRKR
jgi:hypothetical protein